MARETNYAKELFDATVRIQSMIWLPSLLGDEQDSDLIEGLIEWLPELPTAQIYSALPELKQLIGGEDYPTEEDLVETLRTNPANERGGFLIQVATPVRSNFARDGKSHQFSWGHYKTEWIAVRSETEIASAMISWAEKCVAEDRLANAEAN